jgi:L-fucose dehydrogenase
VKLDLTDNVVLVAGNSKELKDSIRKTLAEEGAIGVFITGKESRDGDQPDTVQTEGNYEFHFIAGVDPAASIRLEIEKLWLKYRWIDGLVILPDLLEESKTKDPGPENLPASTLQDIAYAYLLVRHTLPALKESKGALVSIFRELQTSGQPNAPANAALSGGQSALTREWAVELLKYGIRVNAVLVKDSGENGRNNSSEIASIVVFLLSGKSSHTTGQLLYAGK